MVENVDAGNMVGAATDGLVFIRRQFFPKGELEDGGGAVPPTAAGKLWVSTGQHTEKITTMFCNNSAHTMHDADDSAACATTLQSFRSM